jgi:hypothetical protein
MTSTPSRDAQRREDVEFSERENFCGARHQYLARRRSVFRRYARTFALDF